MDLKRLLHLPPVFQRLALAGGLLVAGVAVYFATPGSSRWLPPCIFHKLTGLHCPGCGNTRALHALVHGDLRASLAYNPLLIPALLLFLFLLCFPRLACKRWLCLGVAIVVVLFFIARNLPWPPFSWLAPGALL